MSKPGILGTPVVARPAGSGAVPPAGAVSRDSGGRETMALLDMDLLSACIRCGECLPVCPTYRVTRRETLSPRGRIALARAVAVGEAAPEEIQASIETCLGCMACQTACPVGVEYGRILQQAKAVLDTGEAPGEPGRTAGPKGVPKALPRRRRWVWRFMMRAVLPNRRALALLAALEQVYRRLGLAAFARRIGLDQRLLGPLALLQSVLPGPSPAPEQGRGSPRGGTGSPSCFGLDGGGEGALRSPGMEQVGTRHGTRSGRRGLGAKPVPGDRAVLFRGCIQEAFLGDVNRATESVLQGAGLELVEAPGQGCCGALSDHAGDHSFARKLARRNVEAFEGIPEAWIVSNAGGCGAFLSTYPEVLKEEPEWQERASHFAARVRDLSQVLVALQGAGRARVGEGVARPLRVTLQHSCHLRHVQGVVNEPREVLRSLPGVAYVEMPDAERCCGSAGTYNLTHTGLSMQILDAKMEDALSVEPDVIVTVNPGCELQMRLGVQRAGVADRVRVASLPVLVEELTRAAVKRTEPPKGVSTL